MSHSMSPSMNPYSFLRICLGNLPCKFLCNPYILQCMLQSIQ